MNWKKLTKGAAPPNVALRRTFKKDKFLVNVIGHRREKRGAVKDKL